MKKIYTCPFCTIPMIGNIAEHMERCSLEDARRKLTKAGSQASLEGVLSSIGVVKEALTFIGFYDRFGVDERNHMFACEDCYRFVVDFDDIPYVCKECGGQMVIAPQLIKDVR